MNLISQRIESGVGPLYLVADHEHLHAVIFELNWKSYSNGRGISPGTTEISERAAQQLKEYFAGRRKVFDIPYTIENGTEFQQQVWKALAAIPYGKTYSYKHQAEIIGRPKAVRAVGGTNALNPLSIILPCHRVIASSGKLTGYAGGLDKKEFLLRLEGIEI